MTLAMNYLRHTAYGYSSRFWRLYYLYSPITLYNVVMDIPSGTHSKPLRIYSYE
jgi:hypothetical protein